MSAIDEQCLEYIYKRLQHAHENMQVQLNGSSEVIYVVKSGTVLWGIYRDKPLNKMNIGKVKSNLTWTFRRTLGVDNCSNLRVQF